MCLIIHSPKGTTIGMGLIEAAYSHNHDGWGVLAHLNNKLYVKKGFKLKKLKREVRKLNEEDTEVLVHLRYATHGHVNIENCHPFPIGKRSYVMHNGILDHVPTHEDITKSDTWHFAKKATKTFPYLDEVIDDADFTYEIDMYTFGSRVAIMRDDGKVVRYNEEDWHLDKESGLYLSNLWSCTMNKSYYEWNSRSYSARDDDYEYESQWARAVYRDSVGEVYSRTDDLDEIEDWGIATKKELDLMTTYFVRPDRLLINQENGVRLHGKITASELTIELEMQILDMIESWGGPSWAPREYQAIVKSIWSTWMLSDTADQIETEELVEPEELSQEDKELIMDMNSLFASNEGAP